MVDDGTWNKLSGAEQREYSALSERFIEAVFSSSSADGWHFSQEYQIAERDGIYFLVKSGDPAPFAGITSGSRAVIDALLTDAVQNYGR